MAKTESGSEALEKQPTNTAVEAYDFGEDAGAGFENQTNADRQVPFIKILQALSPELETIPGAKAGMLLNSVTQELYDGSVGILIVPGTTKHQFAEYTPRKEGGGFHGHHEPTSPIVKAAKASSTEFGEYKTADGKHELTETFYVIVATCDEDGNATGMAMLANKSTHIKPYKAWMAKLAQLMVLTPAGKKNPPLFANLTRMKTRSEKNNQGTFYVPVFESADPRGPAASLLRPGDDRYELAKSAAAFFNSGAAAERIDYGAAQNAGGTPGQDPETAAKADAAF